MRGAYLMVFTVALVAARPETYKENEDFKYSRSSTDEGSKTGFYEAQRGNVGGNYERAHNMDTLAQHQMSGVVKQVEGELGDTSKARTGNVFTSANSRGYYGNGKFDLSALEGRNFQESLHQGSSLHSSLSQNDLLHSSSINSGYSNTAAQNSRYSSGYQQSGATDQALHSFDSANRYSTNAASNYNSEAMQQGDSRYYQLSGHEGQNAYDETQSQSGAYGSNIKTRLISGQPATIIIRPGTTFTIPVGAQVYDANRALMHDYSSANRAAEVLSSNTNQRNYIPSENVKHYQSSYDYRKQWERQDMKPIVAVPLAIPTIPKNSELIEDTRGLISNYDSKSHSADASHAYNSYDTKSSSSAQSRYNAQQSLSSASNSNTYHDAAYNSATNGNLANLVTDIDSRPKTYQSSYSYHKSWERQGDPYVIYPSSNNAISERLTSGNLYGNGHLCTIACDPNNHIRQTRSAISSEIKPSYEDFGQQTQQLHNFGQHSQKLEDFGQQSQKFEDFGQQSQKLEDFGQQSQRLENFGQKSQNMEDLSQQSQKLEDFGQQSQRLENFGQQSQKFEDFGQQSQKIEDFVQQSQKLEDFGQQRQKLEDFGQQSQKLEDFGQESQKLEDFGQQSQRLENFGQQSQKLEDFGQQSQKMEDFGQQSQKLEDFGQQSQRLENFGQQSQKLEDFGQQSQKLEDFGQESQKLEDFGQQSQRLENFGQQSQKPEDFGQQSQKMEDFGQQSQKLEDFGQQSQKIEDFVQQSQKLEDFGQQSQKLEDFGQQSQKFEDLGQQSQRLEDFGQHLQRENVGPQNQYLNNYAQHNQNYGQYSQELDNFGQINQELKDFGQQNQQAHNFGAHVQDLGQQTLRLGGYGHQIQHSGQKTENEQPVLHLHFVQFQKPTEDVGQHIQNLHNSLNQFEQKENKWQFSQGKFLDQTHDKNWHEGNYHMFNDISNQQAPTEVDSNKNIPKINHEAYAQNTTRHEANTTSKNLNALWNKLDDLEGTLFNSRLHQESDNKFTYANFTHSSHVSSQSEDDKLSSNSYHPYINLNSMMNVSPHLHQSTEMNILQLVNNNTRNELDKKVSGRGDIDESEEANGLENISLTSDKPIMPTNVNTKLYKTQEENGSLNHNTNEIQIINSLKVISLQHQLEEAKYPSIVITKPNNTNHIAKPATSALRHLSNEKKDNEEITAKVTEETQLNLEQQNKSFDESQVFEQKEGRDIFNRTINNTQTNKEYKDLYQQTQDQDLNQQNQKIDFNKQDEKTNNYLQTTPLEIAVQQSYHFNPQNQFNEDFGQETLQLQNFDTQSFVIGGYGKMTEEFQNFENLNQQLQNVHDFDQHTEPEESDQKRITGNVEILSPDSQNLKPSLNIIYNQQHDLQHSQNVVVREQEARTIQEIKPQRPYYFVNKLNEDKDTNFEQIKFITTTEVPPITEKPSFWTSVGSKFSNAKDTVVSWFRRS